MNDYNEILNQKFNRIKATIKKPSFYGAEVDQLELVLEIKIDQNQWNEFKKKKQNPIDRMNLVVDLSNFLSRSIRLGVHLPSVGGIKDRCKKGYKHLTFTYIITTTDLELFQIETPEIGNRYGFYKTFNLGPIRNTSNLKLVNE